MLSLNQKWGMSLAFVSALVLVAFSTNVFSVEDETSVKTFHYKTHYYRYYKKFRHIERLHKRGKYYGIIMPANGAVSSALYQSPDLKVPSAVVKAGSLCQVINHRELYIKNSAQVVCGRRGKGFMPLSKLAYDVILKVSANRKTMIVTWRTVCGGDSCSTKNWLFYSLKVSRRKKRQGWMREIKQRDNYFIHPAGKYFLFTVLSTQMTNSPKKPKIYFQDIGSGNTKLLVAGLSPSFHPHGKLIFYRDKKGSVYGTTLTASKVFLVYPSPYSEKEMYHTGTAVSSGQSPVKFARWNRLSISFKKLAATRNVEWVQHKVNIKKLMLFLKRK